MKRKSPVHHQVQSHKRKGKTINSYTRGRGSKKIKIANPSISLSARDIHMRRIRSDVNALISGMGKALREIDPSYKIQCKITGSLKRNISGESQIFRTVYGGKSGTEERGSPVSSDYKSDVDIECTVNFENLIDVWDEMEDKLWKDPEKYLPRIRNECLGMTGKLVKGEPCIQPFLVPLDEKNLRKTHPVIIHWRK